MVVLFDRFNMPEDIYEVIFATEQQYIVAKLLIREMQAHEGEFSKTEMSIFATKLHEGNLLAQIDRAPYAGKVVKISYNKRQFYDRILTPMKSMGMIEYDLYRKTYKVSEKFTKSIQKIGIMWLREARPSYDLEKKRLPISSIPNPNPQLH